MRRYELDDVKEANLFREQFPYTEVPRITFDYKPVPMNLPKDFWITCTTFRDGQQARPPYTVKQIVDLYDMLHRLGGPKGVIRQCEFFLYSDKDKEAVNKCLEWHGHNDFHKVIINAVTAWLYGCCAANGTLLGFGERTGNSPIEGLIMEYIGLKESQEGMDTRVITEIAGYYTKEIGAEIPSNYPFVGKHFNVTQAGIHADGVIKDEEIYNIFDTAKILNRPMGISINDKSGLAGIALWVDLKLGLAGDRKINKHHPGIAAIDQWVKEVYTQKRTTAISDEEMLEQARKHLPEYF